MLNMKDTFNHFENSSGCLLDAKLSGLNDLKQDACVIFVFGEGYFWL